ncbi:MAG: hypothetical protein J0H98_07220 [Solirubrobacterales bacterium]|nr:hypothetical protein [Solirubrobacterales bacterium]
MTDRFSGVVPLEDLTVAFEQPGLWEITANLMDRVPDARTGSLVMRRAVANPKPEDTETFELGHTAVDTGHVAIVAEKFGPIGNWDRYAAALLENDLEGGDIARVDGTIVVASGLGDGKYAVYGTRLRATGELVRVAVDFTPNQAAWDLIYGSRK